MVRLRDAQAASSDMPAHLRRPVLEDWCDPAEFGYYIDAGSWRLLDPRDGEDKAVKLSVACYQRWSDARRAWAAEHNMSTYELNRRFPPSSVNPVPRKLCTNRR